MLLLTGGQREGQNEIFVCDVCDDMVREKVNMRYLCVMFASHHCVDHTSRGRCLSGAIENENFTPKIHSG